MTTDKVFKMENSNAIRLNRKIIKENDEISIGSDSTNGCIIIKPKKKAISEDFIEALQSSFEKNKAVLDFLKDK